MRRKLYSYLRWSSAVQADGTTKARQTHAAEQYAAQHDLEIVEIVDDGISGFKGANARAGALGQFLDAVDQGLIPTDAYLFVESLDRITREEIDVALELFLGILRRGITIHTGMDSKTYTRDSIKGNPIDLLTSILLFTRAHEESKTKQKRTYGNALALIRRFQEEKLPVTIKSIGSHPWWIDASTTQYESVKPHPVFFPIAQFAINHFMEGKSAFKVTQLLDQHYPHAYKNKAWPMANISKLRLNPAVYGMRELEVEGNTYKLENYFPALITEGQFLRLQQIRETTKYLGWVNEKQQNNINLLAGLRLFRCGHCNGTMMGMRQGDNIRYMCGRGRGYQHDCKTWSLPGILVEHCLMIVTTMAYIDIQQKGGMDKQDYTLQITNTESLIADFSTRISNVTSLIARGLGNVEEVVQQIRTMEDQKNHLTLELEVLQRKQILSSDTTFETLMEDFFELSHYAVLKDPLHENRHKLRDIICSAIGDVRAWKFDRKLYLSFQIKGKEEYINFSAGDTPYEWKFNVDNLPVFTNESEEQERKDSLKYLESTFTQLNEERKFSKNHEWLKAGMMDQSFAIAQEKLLNDIADLLQVIGYPLLDSKLFWPKK